MSITILNEALELLKTGERNQALALLVHYVKQNPDDATAWYYLAIAVDENDQKIDCLERSLTLDPDFPEASELLKELKTQIQTDTVLDVSNDIYKNLLDKVMSSTPINPVHEESHEPFLNGKFEQHDKPLELSGDAAKTADQTIDPFQYRSVFDLQNLFLEKESNSTASHSSMETSAENNLPSKSTGGFNQRFSSFMGKQNKIDQAIFYLVFVLLILCIPIILLLVLRIFTGL